MAKRDQQRWTTTQARRELARWESSGQTIAAYCRENGLHPKRLYNWRRRLEGQVLAVCEPSVQQRPATQSQPRRWIEATVTPAMHSEAVVAISNGWDVRIEVSAPERVTVSWLGQLWRSVQGGC